MSSPGSVTVKSQFENRKTEPPASYNANMVAAPNLTMMGHTVDTTPDAFGQLVDSTALLEDGDALRARMADDGYLFLRGHLDRDQVAAARLEICRRLANMGYLDERYPIIEAIPTHDKICGFDPPALTMDNEPLMRLLYAGRMITFYESLLGGPVSHFDYTWFRTLNPNCPATCPHCDVVYMGRGTHNLYTSWTPIGDAPIEDGPLCIMQGSHRVQKLHDHYCRTDVDTVCRNRKSGDGQHRLQSPNFGRLSNNPPRLRKNLGLPFLTTDFKAGDLLVFSIFTIHCGLDNVGKRIRMSSDSRYQLACEAQDERWISIGGKPPIAHGEHARQELVC